MTHRTTLWLVLALAAATAAGLGICVRNFHPYAGPQVNLALHAEDAAAPPCTYSVGAAREQVVRELRCYEDAQARKLALIKADGAVSAAEFRREQLHEQAHQKDMVLITMPLVLVLLLWACATLVALSWSRIRRGLHARRAARRLEQVGILADAIRAARDSHN